MIFPQHHFQRWPQCLGWRVWSCWSGPATQHHWAPSQGIIHTCRLWNGSCLSLTSFTLIVLCLFPRLCVSVNEMPRRGRKLALRWRGGAGEWAARRRPEAMLCLDAALPTDTTGNNMGGGGDYFLEGWGEPLIQTVWGGVRLRGREGTDGEGAVLLCDG